LFKKGIPGEDVLPIKKESKQISNENTKSDRDEKMFEDGLYCNLHVVISGFVNECWYPFVILTKIESFGKV
jgi:hypothetical protein